MGFRSGYRGEPKPTLSQKDFELAARMIKNLDIPDEFSNPALKEIYKENVIKLFTYYFRDANNRFKEHIFLRACGK
jgi:hypothetical protein